VATGLVVSGTAAVLAGGWLAPRLADAAITGAGHFVLFYSGVLTLVALTLSVVIGLVATDRLVLASRHRIRAQAVHRAMAFTAVAGLAVHVAANLIDARIQVIDVILPFRVEGRTFDRTFALGLGTVACLLMIAITASGIARGRFAVADRPWLWRPLHGAAYVAWPLAIAHGLMAGRTPAGWVTLSYGLCLAAVAFALATRFLVEGRSRRDW